MHLRTSSFSKALGTNNKAVFMICMLSVIIVTCSQSFTKNTPLVIGIGQQCTIGFALREYGIREAAYPFDWIICFHDSLIRCLKEDFEHFFDPKSLTLYHNGKAVVDHYGHVFGHDLPTVSHAVESETGEVYIPEGSLRSDWQDYIPAVYEKYQRRIARFRKALEGTNHIYLIRHVLELTPNDALEIQQLIQKHYPNLSFTLIAVGETNVAKQDWNLPGIKNFYLEKRNPHNPEQRQWEQFFASLGIQPNSTQELETSFQE